MLIMDWGKLRPDNAKIVMSDLGFEDISGLTIFEILARVGLESHEEVKESFPARLINRGQKINIEGFVADLISTKTLTDSIGNLRPYVGMRIFFPTLVYSEIREYLQTYSRVLSGLKELGFQPTIWLEDRLSVINNGWNIANIKSGTILLRDFFQIQVPDCEVITSSEVSNGISTDFAEKQLSKVTGSDLISILPYRSRYPWSTRVIDVVHFAWMCYLSKQCPGIHLAGSNNKRHYQIFRSKVAGRDLTALLFKLGSEKTLPSIQTKPRL
jgi:hypothetical protein